MRNVLTVAAVAALMFGGGTARADETARAVNPGTPAPECTLHVNYDRNADLPGYSSGSLCLPFMPTNQLVPPGRGPDFYVTEFSDAAIRRRWVACKQDPACYANAIAGAKPFIAYEPRVVGRVDPFGKIDPEGEVDLRAIRRPAYFGRPPYNEPIAGAEGRTSTVEFTVPRDSYERRHLGREGNIKLRGWYIAGDGLPVPDGSKRRALVILNNGGGSELTALDDPRALGVERDRAGKYVLEPRSDGMSEQHGMRHWRGFIAA